MSVGIGRGETRLQRPVADHDLRAGQVELEESLDILFDREAPTKRKMGRGNPASASSGRGRNNVPSTPRDQRSNCESRGQRG